jgi:hypothetical protein
MRDQSKALSALEAVERSEETTDRSENQKAARADTGTSAADQSTATKSRNLHVAAVERSRIASIGGLTALIWLVILVLMAWH